MSEKYKVIIADDDNLVCTALEMILKSGNKIEIPALGHDGHEAVRLYEQYRPDLMLLDIRMGEFTGLDAAESILNSFPDAKILFLTTFEDDEYIARALKLGAKGYILKQNFDCILPSIDAVMNGQRVFGDNIINKLPSLYSSAPTLEKYDLSEREPVFLPDAR